MTGTIVRRGKTSWRLKYDLPRDAKTGRRRIAYATVKGKRADAERELRRLLHAVDHGIAVEPSRITVSEYLDQWLRDLETTTISPKTAERYRGLIDKQIAPHLGEIPLQRLRPAHIADWHASLLRSGRHDGSPLAARTARNAHAVLRTALERAAGTEMVARNVAAVVSAPKVESTELQILTADQVADVLAKLEGTAIYPIVILALASGMRRGEMLALRWSDVDFEGAKVRVERSLEQTNAGLRLKSPKTKAGRRLITLPEMAVAVLREHRRQQLESRLALGLGKLSADALVFSNMDGSPRSPRAVSKQWSSAVKSRDLPDITFHTLRHVHASALVASGVDVLTISRRLGHGSPSTTLGIYGHLFSDTDQGAAAAIGAALAGSKNRS